MSKPITNDPDLLEEYDFSKAEVGKYARRYAWRWAWTIDSQKPGQMSKA
ncbi:MAG: hypothetical protein SFV15_14540 [Polyangiaceae bacterium]|nr:hypothetical protein [Polyangiaceae bacterium]